MTRAAGRVDGRRLRRATRPRRRSRRSTGSRPRTPPRRCRPSRSRARCPSASRAARSVVGGRAGQPGQLACRRSPARLTVASSSAASGPPASASRGAHRRRPRASRATLRPISARNQAEMPGRLADDRLRARRGGAGRGAATAGESDGVEEPAQDDRRGRALRVAGDSHAWPRLVDPADRLVGLGVAGVDPAR